MNAKEQQLAPEQEDKGAPPETVAAADLPDPQVGGSYARNPETGALTRIEQTQG
jgi:hypothetical protein